MDDDEDFAGGPAGPALTPEQELQVELQLLAELRSGGVIDDEELAAARARLLSRSSPRS